MCLRHTCTCGTACTVTHLYLRYWRRQAQVAQAVQAKYTRVKYH
jgi:hypothetical protein